MSFYGQIIHAVESAIKKITIKSFDNKQVDIQSDFNIAGDTWIQPEYLKAGNDLVFKHQKPQTANVSNTQIMCLDKDNSWRLGTFTYDTTGHSTFSYDPESVFFGLYEDSSSGPGHLKLNFNNSLHQSSTGSINIDGGDETDSDTSVIIFDGGSEGG